MTTNNHANSESSFDGAEYLFNSLSEAFSTPHTHAHTLTARHYSHRTSTALLSHSCRAAAKNDRS